MTASVEKLRWMLVAGSLLLLLLLAGFLGYGRYKQAKKWLETIKRLNLHGPHETRGFTYSSSPKDRTSYKIHAERVVEHGDGTWSLYNVDATLYSKTSPDENHIRASDIEYDQNTGVARAIGIVHMDFEAPGALKRTKTAAMKAEDDGEASNVIHVLTSDLVYVKKLDVASTDQPIEIRYSGLDCKARGAEFDSEQTQLRLLADVVVTGMVNQQPVTMHAVRAALDRTANTVELEHPVVQSHGRTVTAAHAFAHLRKDGSVEHADADGGVTMDEGTRHLVGASYSGTFSEVSLPQTARLFGGVTLSDTDTSRPLHGKAAEANAIFTAAGDPQEVTLSGEAQFVETKKTVGQPDSPREMRGDRIVAEYEQAPIHGGHKMKPHVREIRLNGSAFVSEVAAADAKGGMKTTQLSADELRAETASSAKGSLSIQQMSGSGHTKIIQLAPQGAQQVSSGDTLTASFTPDRNGISQLANASQTGHVMVHTVAATKPGAPPAEAADATASRGSYDGSENKMTLAGDVHFEQGRFDLSAATVSVNQLTGDAQASGNIVATVRPDETPKSGVAKTTPQQPTHITAERATMLHASQLVEFVGTNAHPARLWQSASEVQAASLLFDQKKKSIAARPESGGKVHAVFARTVEPSIKKAVTADDVIRVSSSTMDYDDLHREGTFTGGVRMDGNATQAQSQRAVVLLEPAATKDAAAASTVQFGGQLRRVVLLDSVQLSQPGRTGTGNMLVYSPGDANAAGANYTLSGTSGHPPHIVDAKQGSITGATLVFHDEGTGAANSTIIVTGSEAPDKPGRVRSEVEVKSK